MCITKCRFDLSGPFTACISLRTFGMSFDVCVSTCEECSFYKGNRWLLLPRVTLETGQLIPVSTSVVTRITKTCPQLCGIQRFCVLFTVSLYPTLRELNAVRILLLLDQSYFTLSYAIMSPIHATCSDCLLGLITLTPSDDEYKL